MKKGQYEGSAPPNHNVGTKVSSGTATPKLRKASVTPTPSDRGNMDRGKG